MEWSDGIALASLALSGFVLFRQWQSQRTAHIEVTWEEFQRRQSRSRAGHSREPDAHWVEYRTVTQTVLTNHGPAVARDVQVRLLDAKDGREWQNSLYGLPAEGLPALAPTQSYAMDYAQAFGQQLVVEVSWKDGRRKRQTSTVTPSRRYR